MLHVHEFGNPDGPGVLAVHGLCGHGRRFAHFAAHELPHRRVLAPDLRGHGRSTWVPPWNFEQHVEDLLAVLDASGVEKAAVMGHSFGGAIAVQLARAAPERVSHLVLLDPSIGLDPGRALDLAQDSMVPTTFDSAAAATAAKAAEWSESPAWTVPAEVADHLEPAGRSLRWRYCPPMTVAAWSEMSRPHVTPPRQVPVLLVRARRADFVSAAFVDDCRSACERLRVLPVDTGHQVHLDAEAQVGAAVRELLTR